MVYRNFTIKVTYKKNFRYYCFRDCQKNHLDTFKQWEKELITPNEN